MNNFMQDFKNEHDWVGFVQTNMDAKFKQDWSYVKRIESNIGHVALGDHMFFVTVKYRNASELHKHKLNNHMQKVNKRFDDFHRHLCKVLIDGNYRRKIHLQPFCFTFLDGAATKLGGAYGVERAGESSHHHVIVYIHPLILQKFRDYIASDGFKEYIKSSNNIESIDVQALKSYDELPKIVSYASKMTRRLCDRHEIYENLFNVLPAKLVPNFDL